MDLVTRSAKVEPMVLGGRVVAYVAIVAFGDVVVERAVMVLPDVIADMAFERARNASAIVVEAA